jgi:hypothetical protein
MKPPYSLTLRRGLPLVVLFLILLAESLWAQNSQNFHFTYANRKSLRIPFELHSNLIVVPLHINGSDTLNFILDSGISMTLLTDPKIAKALGLKYVRKVQITGVGEGESLEALVAINNKINLNGIEASGQSIVALSEDVLHLSNYVGMPIHGIFGFDLFRHFVVRIDFNNKILTLYHPDKYEYKGKGEKIPITIEDAKPYLQAKAIWADNRSVPIKVILDTGAGHALSLDMGSHEEIQIGKFELQNVITSFPDTNSAAAQIAKRVNRQGNIGCELLRRFDVVFDYSRNYVVLKPNKRLLRASFERDMSGIDLKAKGDDYRSFVIDRLEDNSPAMLAGLMEGDEIISINGQIASQMRLSEIYKMLQRKEGKEIRIFVRRGVQFIYTSFYLKRLI